MVHILHDWPNDVSMTPDWKRTHVSSGFHDFPVLTGIANAEKWEISTICTLHTATMRVVCGAGHCLPPHLHISLSKQCSLKVNCRCGWNILTIPEDSRLILQNGDFLIRCRYDQVCYARGLVANK